MREGDDIGFSTIAVFAMIFAVSVVVGTSIFLTFNDYIDAVQDASKEFSDRELNEIHTSIAITKVDLDGEEYDIYLENTGSTTLDPDYLILFDTQNNPDYITSSDYTINPSNEYWDPSETIIITYDKGVDISTIFKVVAENGVSNSYYYIP